MNLIAQNDNTPDEKYKTLLPQIDALLSGESDLVANLANISAVLKDVFNFLWVGFYLVKDDQLVLGPFQGRAACTRINYGKGVCGTAWKENRTIIVADVHCFEGHIACDSASRSEIVVPIHNNGTVMGVLDIDSEFPDYFNATDKYYLEQIVTVLEDIL